MMASVSGLFPTLNKYIHGQFTEGIDNIGHHVNYIVHALIYFHLGLSRDNTIIIFQLLDCSLD